MLCRRVARGWTLVGGHWRVTRGRMLVEGHQGVEERVDRRECNLAAFTSLMIVHIISCI